MKTPLTVEDSALTPAGICEAARNGDVQAIDLILATRPELLSVNNPHPWTKTVPGHHIRGSHNKKPVEVAAFFNQPAAVAKLLEIARDSHAICKPWDDHLPFDGLFNSLGVAIAMGHADVIQVIESEVLKRIYVNPKLLDAADGEGRTALFFAVQQGHLPLVQQLIDRGADVNAIPKSGQSLVHVALRSSAEDRRAVAKLLLESGATDDLWIAIGLDDFERAKTLLAEDRNRASQHFFPDAPRSSDGFPLVRACATGNQQLVELLLEHGADINAAFDVLDPPEFGMPLVTAVYSGHYAIANLLLDRGADANAHPNCAAPFVDMLYYAHLEHSPDWLALHELKHVTNDVRSHLQPNQAGHAEIVKLYERVLALGAKPQTYSLVKMNIAACSLHGDKQPDTAIEIERLLREEVESQGMNPGGPDTVFNCLSHAAAWLGDAPTMEMCHRLQPGLLSAATANQHIRAAIRSHNRDGVFKSYRRIIEMSLQYLKQIDEHINEAVTVQPLILLANDYLENYSYGTAPQLPAMDELLELAQLFLDFGVDINERTKGGNTALAAAVDNGHAEYVEFLLNHGAEVCEDGPPETNPRLLARKHGFVKIATLLGDTNGPWGEVTRSDFTDMEPPAASKPPILMARWNNTVIRLGVATIDRQFHPRGNVDDTHSLFIEFPEPFPDDELDNVRLHITNRNHPQVIGSATTGRLNGVQGFLLKARNCNPTSEIPAGETGIIDGVSFSWMAMLPTDKPQQKRFEVRYGLIPWREYHGRELHSYTDTGDLYADEPLRADGDKFVFLTTTVSNVVNGAVSEADEHGITDLTAFQATRHDGGGRIFYMVVAERTEAETANPPPSKSDPRFDANELWVQAYRAKPVGFYPNGVFCAWRTHWMPMLCPFRERKPCVFVTANAHGVVGHQSTMIAMSRDCRQNEFQVIGLSVDPIRGQSNFDCIAIGHCGEPMTEIEAANETGLPAASSWKRFIAMNVCDEAAFEMAAAGEIGVNEFGEHGGSLLSHAIDERHQRVNVALARRLFALGTDANQRHPVTHVTPLHLAAVLKRVEMTNLLIERGADVDAKTVPGTESTFPTMDVWRLRRQFGRPHWGETPLHLAMLRTEFEIVRLLLDAGADPNAEDENGDRPIDYLPAWHTYPDNKRHWRLINRQVNATKEDYMSIIDWIRNRDE